MFAVVSLIKLPHTPSSLLEAELHQEHAAGDCQLEAATRLMAMGADVTIPDSRGASPVQFALQSANEPLACLMQHYHSVQACLAFRRISDAQPGVCRELVGRVCQYLVPR